MQEESVKINQLEIENVKRIKACTLTPTTSGLTVIGGKNGQGKTSALDAIAWALGGDRYRPSNPQRDGSAIPPQIHITLSNGVVVERSGKNAALKVTDTTGRKSGQQLLNEFVSQLAIDLPRFLQSNSKEKAETLLQIIGLGDQLRALDLQEQQKYNARHALGQIVEQKKKFAQELQNYPDAPSEPVSATELIVKQQSILARNGENQRLRLRRDALEANKRILGERLAALQSEYDRCCADLETASRSAADLQDESTAELEESIRGIEELNRKVRANLDKEKAMEDANSLSADYDALTADIEAVRSARMNLLRGAKMPLPELSVEDGDLTYKEKRWDCMSSSEQLIVGTAIAKAVNPRCGFVLLDKLEQLDADTLQSFGRWLTANGLQVIATRVSTGSECSVIIEDGYAVQPEPTWKEGVF